MQNKLNISLISRNGVSYQGEALEVILPTKAGVIAVLPNHTELVSALKEGEIKIKINEKEEKVFPIFGGVLEVRKNSNVIILVD